MTELHSTPDDAALGPRLAAEARRLVDILERESKLLEGMDPVALAALLPDKREATASYRALIGEVAERPQALAELGAREKADLRTAAERLAQATEANARALKAGIDANRRLVGAIAQAVQKKHDPADFYQSSGRVGQGGPKGTPPAVSFNHVL